MSKDSGRNVEGFRAKCRRIQGVMSKDSGRMSKDIYILSTLQYNENSLTMKGYIVEKEKNGYET